MAKELALYDQNTFRVPWQYLSLPHCRISDEKAWRQSRGIALTSKSTRRLHPPRSWEIPSIRLLESIFSRPESIVQAKSQFRCAPLTTVPIDLLHRHGPRQPAKHETNQRWGSGAKDPSSTPLHRSRGRGSGPLVYAGF